MITADLMSRLVVAISPDAPLAQAIRLMLARRVSGLPVVDAEGRAVGMLTEGDLLRRVETGTEGKAPGWLASFFFPGRQAERYMHTHGRRVSEVMTSKVVSVKEDTPLAKVVTLMQRHRIKRLPVLRDGKVVGIVSRADLMRIVSDSLGRGTVTADDVAIRKTIVEGLASAPWVPRTAVSVAVENGVVLLDGCVSDLRCRSGIGVLAENVPGVKRVDNRVICVEPETGKLIYDPADEDDAAVGWALKDSPINAGGRRSIHDIGLESATTTPR